MLKRCVFLAFCIALASCKEAVHKDPTSESNSNVIYAKGFEIENFENYSILSISNPWPESEVEYRYLLKKSTAPVIGEEEYDAVLNIPIQSIVVTSTTHIPSLEMLGVEQALLGFPNLDYVSSERTRSLISRGAIKELGKNESLNTEVLIEIRPDVVVTFAVEGKNNAIASIEHAGIPVLYNADWTETHPLGKAEWIKFFGVLFGKVNEADRIFTEIERDYNKAKTLACSSSSFPTVLSGAMYKDIWYLPQGDSWAAKFIEDAHGNYLWEDRKGIGSLSLNLESVLETGKDAAYWIGPSQFEHYDQLLEAHSVYSEFKAFQDKKVYGFMHKKGITGGVIYYELAPNRPDLVLKDMIKILHPELLPDYELFFFAPLN